MVYDGRILVIAPEYANWIVFNSDVQLAILEYLRKGNSILDTLSCNKYNEDDINYVVTQLEARRFCGKAVHSSIADERSLHLYLTNKCNLSCLHCYMFSGVQNESELPTDEILKLLSDYRNIAKGNSLTLSGGESSSHIDFDKIVEFSAG